MVLGDGFMKELDHWTSVDRWDLIQEERRVEGICIIGNYLNEGAEMDISLT